MNADQQRFQNAKLAYLCTWIAFVATVLYLDWGSARPHHVVVGILAFPGALAALFWILKGGKWVYAAGVFTAALLLGYVTWWGIEISRLESLGSFWSRIWIQMRIHTGVPSEYLAKSHYAEAAAQVYWLILMPLVQLACLPLLYMLLPRRAHAA